MTRTVLFVSAVVAVMMTWACGSNNVVGPLTETPTATATATEVATGTATATPTATPTDGPGGPTPTATASPTATSSPDLKSCQADGVTGSTKTSLTWGFRWYGNRTTSVQTTVILNDGSTCTRADGGLTYGAACKVIALAPCTTYTASYHFEASDGSTCNAGPKDGKTQC